MATQFKHEDVARVPRGFKVRTVTHPSGHKVRLAFPPGPRRVGAGQVVSILHPKGENPRKCAVAGELRNLGVGARHGVPVPNPKSKTREQVEKMQAKAVKFLRDVVGDSAKADEIEGLSLAEYAERKKVALSNPRGKSKGKGQKSKGKSVPAQHQQRVQEMLAKMPKPIRDVFDRNPSGPGFDVYAEGSSGRASRKRAPTLRAAQSLGRRLYSSMAKPATIWIVDRASQKVVTSGATKGYSRPKLNPKARKRRNQASEQGLAAELYKTFHGKEPKEILEFQQDIIRRKDYTALGKLIEIVVQDAGKLIVIDFSTDDVVLASNADGSQLYLIGGNQDVRAVFDKATFDQSKDLVVLGLIKKVVYRARKDFDRYEEIDYGHTMGEGGHEKPTLIFDQLNLSLALAGGEYKVKREGIVH